MTNIVNFDRWKRARRGREGRPHLDRRARANEDRTGGASGFVSIGVISAELVRALMER